VNRSTKQANRARRKIARTFHDISTHRISVTDVLYQTPSCLQRIRVYDVTRRFPGLGDEGADKVLKRAKVWPNIRMGKLDDSHREAILANLPPRAKHGTTKV
jgi:hypothetical protein